MAERGPYRSTYEALADDLDFQDLSFGAQAVFHSLKLKLGQYGIAVFYHQVLYSLHKRQTPAEIDAALVELEQPKPGRPYGWIRREANWVWIVNALRAEPSISLDNPNHRRGALRFAQSLPASLAIVREFVAYYGLAEGAGQGTGDTSKVPNPEPSPSPTHPIPQPSTTPQGSTETDREEKRETDTESETERDLGRERAGAPTHTPAPEPAVGSLANARTTEPPRDTSARSARAERPAHPATLADLLQLRGVRAYLAKHFGAVEGRNLPPAAKRALAELLATLGAGAKLHDTKRRETRPVRAVDLAHLSSTCGLVSTMTLDVPTSANVVVLRKLEETATEIRRLRERDQAEADEAERDRVLGVAGDWLEEHPAVRDAVIRRLEAHISKAKADASPILALSRQESLNALVIEAFRASLGEVPAPDWLPEVAAAAA